MPYADGVSDDGRFCAALRRWRNQMGITATEASSRFGVSLRTWQGWESGKACSAAPIVKSYLAVLWQQERAHRAERARLEGPPN